jgi:hypothetical protein
MSAKQGISALNECINLLKNLSGKELDDFRKEAKILNRNFSAKKYLNIDLPVFTEKTIVIATANITYSKILNSGGYIVKSDSFSSDHAA